MCFVFHSVPHAQWDCFCGLFSVSSGFVRGCISSCKCIFIRGPLFSAVFNALLEMCMKQCGVGLKTFMLSNICSRSLQSFKLKACFKTPFRLSRDSTQMGSSCVSRLGNDGSRQHYGRRQSTKKSMTDAATAPSRRSSTRPTSSNPRGEGGSPPRDTTSHSTTDKESDLHVQRSIVATAKRTLFMVVPSGSPLDHDDQQGPVLQVDVLDTHSLSKESRQRSGEKNASSASMAVVYGNHPIAGDAFDSTHASPLDTAGDNHPAATTRSTYSLNSHDLLRSHSNEGDSSRHRPWRSTTTAGGGAVSPNSQQSSGDDEQRGSSSSAGDVRNLRLPRFHL